MKKAKNRQYDFSINDLPSNRKALFFDILKHKFKYLLLIGFLMFLFLIPSFITSVSLEEFTYNASIDPSIIVDGQFTENGLGMFRAGIITYGFVFALTYLFAFIGLGGLMRIIKLLCWGEGILFFDDFWIGIKQNIKQFLVIAIIFSLGTISIHLAWSTVSIISGTNVLSQNPIFGGLAYGLTFLIINPFSLVLICYSSTYSLKLPKVIFNSFTLFVKKFLPLLVFSLFSLIFYLLQLIPVPLITLVIRIILIIFAFPVFMIASYLYMSKVFDNFINKEAHPELVNKGLYIGEKNDKNI